MKLEIDNFQNAQVKCFVTSHLLFTGRSPKTFQHRFNTFKKLVVDSIWTENPLTPKWNHANVFDNSVGAISVNGIVYKCQFDDLEKVKCAFVVDDENILNVVIIFKIIIGDVRIFEHEDFMEFPIHKGPPCKNCFSFAMMIKMNDMDIMASKMIAFS